ncbi:MAG TPA: M28 family peptidase [Bacteroidales bacterium]|nr:M28 family peptidase [Bacteroidales bacterium]
MIRYLLCFLLSISLVHARSQFCQADSSIHSRIYKDICVLASDSLQGRKSGTTGEKKAYEYIISKFREAGLQPLGTDSGSYLQSLPFQSLDFRFDQAKLKIDDKIFGYFRDFSVTAFSGNGSINGEILDIGKGISLPLAGYDDYKNIQDCRGKIALMDLDVPSGLLSIDSLKGKLTPLYRIKTALSKGAVAVIVWNFKSPFYQSMFDFKHTDTLNVIVIYGSTEVLDYISNHPGGKVNLSVKLNRTNSIFHNVIGFIDNQAPYTIIFGAHYDHMGFSRRSEIRYGADDNASGTATILELARHLRSSGDKRNNYLFIAFSGEEEGLIGSSYFCAHPTIDLDKVNFMFNFDMVGRLGCEGNRITAIATATSPDWRKVFSEIPKHCFRIKKLRGAPPFSDHYGFYLKGIPIAYLTTGLHYDYHTPRDVAGKINYDGMVSIIKFTEDFINSSEEAGKITFRKIPGWYQFTCYASYFFAELDYVLHTGLEGAE